MIKIMRNLNLFKRMKEENKFNVDIHINKDIENKLCSKEIIKNKYEEIYNKLEKFKGKKI